MAKRKNESPVRVEEILQDLMIVQLGLAGVPQHTIRQIVRVDMNRVARIVTHLKKYGVQDAKV